MKKKVISLALMLVVATSILMAASSWVGINGTYELISMGKEFDAGNMKADKAGNFMGLRLNNGFFADNGLGGIVDASLLFHLEDTKAVKWDSSYSIYVGPAYRLDLTDTLGVYGSLGFSMRKYSKTLATVLQQDQKGSMTHLGLGAQAAAQMKMSKNLLLTGGVQAGFHFSVTAQATGWLNSKPQKHDTNSFTVAPFIGIAYAP
ncbi:outer membrane beta-barrel protein [Parasphaerochaeta coccoides]|nr:outer membrane beta-barrel protein [Parasphaerochaeta coccoides]